MKTVDIVMTIWANYMTKILGKETMIRIGNEGKNMNVLAVWSQTTLCCEQEHVFSFVAICSIVRSAWSLQSSNTGMDCSRALKTGSWNMQYALCPFQTLGRDSSYLTGSTFCFVLFFLILFFSCLHFILL